MDTKVYIYKIKLILPFKYVASKNS